MDRLDDKNAIEIADNIWGVGFADYEAGFSNNPYLLVDGDNWVFFDPGLGHPVFRDMILNKIGQVIDLMDNYVFDLFRRFLSNQYSMMHGNDVSSSIMQGLESFKTSVAVMFVDIREFTDWSSRRNVDEVVRMLNRQLELTSKIINSNGGRVNKILGDGILAYFHEQNLPRIIAITRMINDAVRENMLLDVGIGCEYGEVIMGDLGEENRLDYTLIGPAVNFASRMCDSAGKGEVAMTDRLYEKLKQESGDSAVPDSVERIKVRMKASDPEIEGVKFSVTVPI